MAVVEKIGLFLDPIIAIRHEDKYWTPNGNHRLQALKKLGVRTVVALLVPDRRWRSRSSRSTPRRRTTCARSRSKRSAWRALAGAKTSKDEQETGRVRVRAAGLPDARIRYEERPRLSGGAYQSILRRVDEFLDEPMSKALEGA